MKHQLSWHIWEYLELTGMLFEDVRDDMANMALVAECCHEVTHRIMQDRQRREEIEKLYKSRNNLIDNPVT